MKITPDEAKLIRNALASRVTRLTSESKKLNQEGLMDASKMLWELAFKYNALTNRMGELVDSQDTELEVKTNDSN